MATGSSNRIGKLQDTVDAINAFLDAFELVFDNDWDMTKASITDDFMIDPDGTFLEPDLEDESDNWANRGNLLGAYRHLVEVLGNARNPTW
jgi:hypothetical protein